MATVSSYRCSQAERAASLANSGVISRSRSFSSSPPVLAKNSSSRPQCLRSLSRKMPRQVFFAIYTLISGIIMGIAGGCATCAVSYRWQSGAWHAAVWQRKCAKVSAMTHLFEGLGWTLHSLRARIQLTVLCCACTIDDTGRSVGSRICL